MSTIQTNSITDAAGTGAPDFPNGIEVSAGNILVGTTTPHTTVVTSVTPQVQVHGTTASASSILVERSSADANGPTVFLAKDRSGGIVSSGDNAGGIRFTGFDGTNYAEAAGIKVEIDGTPGAGDMPGRLVFMTTSDGSAAATERMRIDSSGNVGIGTASPVSPLHIYLTDATTYGAGTAALDTTNILRVQNGSQVNDTYSGIQLVSENGAGTTGMWTIASVSTSSNYDNHLVFHTRTGSTTYAEAARISSTGDFLVGKTATGVGTVGVEIRPTGLAQFTRDGGTPIGINRQTSNGEFIEFRKNDTVVGAIGVTSGGVNPYIGSEDVTLIFSPAGDTIVPAGVDGASRSGVIDLGNSANRWDTVYAAVGTINTSDRTEKQDIEELNDAERRVAVACKGLLRKYRLKSAVALKGEDARIHFGIIAQDLQDAFTAEGLDAGRYGMFINSTWTEEETGEEKSLMGVRYSELLAFIIAAI